MAKPKIYAFFLRSGEKTAFLYGNTKLSYGKTKLLLAVLKK